jgi:hypothetical protein
VIRFIPCLVIIAITLVGGPKPAPSIVPVCDLSKDFGAYGDKVIGVRGVYYYGLREMCPEKCADGPWPSFIDLIGSNREPLVFDPLVKTLRTVELEAKGGKRLEIWVTAVGRLRTHAKRTSLGPCDRIGGRLSGYGHLGAFPAELEVESFRDIQVKENPKSEHDYAHMYHGAL